MKIRINNLDDKPIELKVKSMEYVEYNNIYGAIIRGCKNKDFNNVFIPYAEFIIIED